MPCRLIFSSVALRQIRRLDPPVHKRIERVLNIIAQNPESGKRLRGPLNGKHAYRVGDWRIIYSIRSTEVYVETVAHRSRAYRQQP